MRAASNAKIFHVRTRPRSLAFFPAILLFTLLPAHLVLASKTKADEQAGAILFRDTGCAHCHGVGGIGGKKPPAS